MAQPKRVTDAFAIFEAIDEVRKLEAKRPNVANLPTMEEAFGRGD